MSSSRIVLSSAVMAIAVLAGSWYAAAAFPLIDSPSILQDQGPGPVEQRAKPVGPDNPVPTRTDYRAAEYPMEARAAGVSGAITLRITLDEVGVVVESRRTAFSIQVATPRITANFSNTSSERLADHIRRLYPTAQVDDIVRALDAMTMAASSAVSQWRYEPPRNGPIAFDVAINFKPDGETSTSHNTGLNAGRLVGGGLLTEGAVRVGGGIKAPTKIKDVRPVYPAEAMRARVTGLVILEARIGKDGSVEAAQVLRSIPLLDQAAIEAVRQWTFTPTLLNGVPTPVIMTVTVNFTLE